MVDYAQGCKLCIQKFFELSFFFVIPILSLELKNENLIFNIGILKKVIFNPKVLTKKFDPGYSL